MKSNTIATPRTDCALATPFTNILQNECYNRMVECSRKLERELAEKTNDVARLRELLERLCDSVSENWDEGIANYFREEANK